MGDIKFYSPVDFDDTSSGVTIEGDLIANANVGIGTTSPHFYNNYRHVTIDGTSGAGFMLRNGGSNKYEQYVDSGGAIFYLVDNDPLKFFTNSTERLRVTGTGNVGIGTTSPATPLDVTGAGRFSGFVRSNFLNTYDNSKSIIGAPSNYVSIYGGSGAEAIRIDSSGNVGIGTTSPAYQLHLSGSGRSLGVKNYITTTLVANSILVGYDSSAVYLGYGYGAKDIHVGSNNSGKVLIRNTNGLVVQYGNVGIGTTSPSQKLHVSGSARITGAIYDSNNSPGTSGQILSSTATGTDWIDQGDITADSADKALSVTLTVKNTETIALTKGQVVCAAPSATPPSGNLIEVKLADNNGTDSMPAIGVLNEGLDAAGGANDEGEAIMFGKVSGIDTSAFSVGDEVFVSDTAGGLTTTKPTGVKYIQKIGVVIRDDASNGTIEVFGAGRTNDVPTPLYIDHANQRVGVGATSPGQKLHVDGNIRVGDSNDVIYSNRFTTLSNSNLLITANTGYDTTFTNGGSERLRITSSGNVGIGTTSPSQKLHVDGNAIVSGIGVGTSTLYSNSINITNSGTLRIGNAEFLSKSSNDLSIYQQKINVTSSGDVGIGTTSPAEKLTVSGDANVTGKFAVGAASVHGTYDFYNQLTSYFNGAMTVDSTFTQTGGGNSTFSGDVGIGTSSPSHKLDIYSNENVPLRIHRPSNANLNSDGAWGIGFSTRGDAITSTSDTRAGIFSYYNGNLFLSAANTSIVADPIDYARLTVLNTGNVGIGTTSPGSRLEVDMGDASGNRLGFTGDGSTTGAALWTNWTTGASYLDFRLGGTSDTYTKMRITNTGNVGIGTTSPLNKLQVTDGSIGIDSQYAIRDNRNNTILLQSANTAASNRTLTIGNATYSNIIIPNGNVGIGTTSPNDKLDIVHTTSNLLGLNYGTNQLRFAVDNRSHIKWAGSSGTFYLSGRGNGLFIGSTSSDASARLHVKGSGTTSSTTALLVENSSGTDLLKVTDDGKATFENGLILDGTARIFNGNTVWLQGNSQTGTQVLVKNDIGASKTSGNILYINKGGATTSSVNVLNAGNILHVKVDGNVGIGTTSPSEKLVVQDGKVSAGHTNTKGYGFHDLSNYTYTANTNRLSLVTAGTEAVSIDNNQNVGIGTTSPDKKLEVFGDIKISGGDYNGLFFENASGTTKTLLYQHASYDALVIKDIVNNADRVTFKNNGNVGIGTTSPQEKLEVEGTGELSFKINNTQYTRSLIITQGGGYSHLKTSHSSGVAINYGQGNAGILSLFNNTTQAVKINANGDSYFNGGNVGIGTTSPGAKLEIRSDGSAAGGAEIRLQHANNNTNDVVSTVNFANNAGSVGMIQGGTAGANNTGYIALFTDIAGSSSERMRVHTNGNVGIGTTSPGAPLDVKSNSVSSADSGIRLIANGSSDVIAAIGEKSTNGGRFHLYDGGAAKVSFYSDGTSNYIAAGNVGIGTTNPHSILHISDANPEFILEDTTNPNKCRIKNNDGGLRYEADYNNEQGNSTHRFFIDGSEKLRIATNGNVGIGTTSPNYALDISKDGGSILNLHRPNSSTAAASFLDFSFNTANATEAVYARIRSDVEVNTDLAQGGDLSFHTANAGTVGEVMRLTQEGNVGIGTTSPSERLSVDGNVEITTGGNTFLNVNHGNVGFIKFTDTSIASPNQFLIQHNYAQNNDFRIARTTGGSDLVINSSGNVGIGTTSPAAPLDVNGNIQITGGSNTLIFDNSTIKWQQYVNTNEFTLRYYNGSNWNERLRVDTDGNVGIGTTNPEAKLHVTDSIRIDTGGAGPSAAPTTGTPTQAQVRNGGDETYYLSEPDTWLTVNIGGTDYVIPAYEA